ncbi:MAG: hypothetical protein R2762_15615 [Bryobacteraceae bacterium]
MARRQYSEAAVLFRKALEYKAASEEHELEQTTDMLMLARALARDGKLGDASMVMARCSAIEKRALANPALDKRTLGGETMRPEWDLQVLSEDEWLLYQGEYERAARGFRAKIDYERSEGVAADPEGMPYLEKLAEAEQALGNRTAAWACYLEAAEEWERRLTKGHPRAAWCRERALELAPPVAETAVSC